MEKIEKESKTRFSELNLKPRLLEAISYMGFETATPIQEQAIPEILNGRDLIACAQTGTGKTGAFVIPVVNMLIDKTNPGTSVLIIVPTRELAIQIEQQIEAFSYFVQVGCKAVYGGGSGMDWDLQKKALINGTAMIVATPGKLISHLGMGYVDFSHIKHLILDEADRMLDMGFIDDINKIISYLPKQHQTLMFSATMPNSIKQLARKILVDPKEISLAVSKPAEGVRQKVFLTYDNQKIGLITELLKLRKSHKSIIIFTSTKSKVSEIVRALNNAKLPSSGISSNLTQDEREKVLRDFKAKIIRILVATDVMSRGIDVKEINMVINYDVPHDAEDYVHRVGRTARAEAKGEAITLVNPKDMWRLQKIEDLIETKLSKLQPPEQLGPGPEWDIKRRKPGNKGKHRKNKRGPGSHKSRGGKGRNKRR